MQFSTVSNLYGRWGIIVQRSEYDAFPPTDNLAFDAKPTKINPEVEAAALTLLFGRYSGGDLVFAHKLGPNTAVAIQRYLAPTKIFPTPIEYYPKALPLHKGGVDVWDTSDIVVRQNAFMSVRSDVANGALNLHSALAISNNSFVFKKNESDYLPALAAAMLFVDDLEAEAFVVPRDSIANFEQVRELLSAVRLGLFERDSD